MARARRFGGAYGTAVRGALGRHDVVEALGYLGVRQVILKEPEVVASPLSRGGDTSVTLVLKVLKPRPGRTRVYGPELLAPLIRCWAVLRAPAGKLLALMLPVLVPMLRAEQELVIADEQARLLDERGDQ